MSDCYQGDSGERLTTDRFLRERYASWVDIYGVGGGGDD